MKKVGLFFITLVIMFFAFCGIYTKATATLSMETGASIRTEGISGLRFKATLSELSEDIIEHGFYVALGNHSFDDMKDAIEAGDEVVGENKLVKAIAPGENLEFAVTIYGMDDAEKYGSQITAIAYAKTESGFVFDTSYTRNIADIARSDYNTRENVGEYITSVANATRVKVTSSDSSVAYYAGLNEVTLADGDIVELIKGTYADDFTINANNVTIKGNNFGVSYDGERNSNESILTCQITIAANTKHLTIDGLKFTGAAKIVNVAGTAGASDNATGNIDNFTFRNNVVETALTSGKGFIYFTEASSSYSNDMVFTGNSFTCTANASTITALVCIDNNRNLTIQNNSFTNAPNKAFYVDDKTKGLAGNLLVSNNIFSNIGTNAFDVDWFSPYPGGDTSKTMVISDNSFSNVAGNAINYLNANTTDKYAQFDVKDNTFTSVGRGVYVERYYSNYSLKINKNAYTNAPTTAYFAVGASSGAGVIDARYNDYQTSGNRISPNSTKYSSSRFNAFAPIAGNPEDITIKLGETLQLDSTSLGLNMNGTVEFLSCESSDNSILTVNNTGLITSAGEGEATVTATIKGYSNVIVNVHVNIVLGINGENVVFMDETSTYSFAGEGEIEWSTSDPSVATIESNGELTAIAPGTVDVILTVDGSEFDRKTIVVTPPEYLVDDDWSSYSNGGIITIEGMPFVKGINAFDNIGSAIAADRLIQVFAGTYSSNFTINQNHVTIVGANDDLVLDHAGSYSLTGKVNITGVVTLSADHFTMNHVTLSKQFKMTNGVDHVSLEEIALNSTSNEPITVAAGHSVTDLTINKMLVVGNAARTLYIYGNIIDLTVSNCVVLDSVTGLYDFIRIGSSNNEGTLGGTVNIVNNYIHCEQVAIMDRKPSADVYNIRNNYFYNCPGVFYARVGATKTGIVYNIEYNTFNSCLRAGKDWDVIGITTTVAKAVNLHYNVFADTGTNSGDYAINISNTATIDCANNYFKGASDRVVSNATGYDSEWELEEGITTESTYDPYKVVLIGGKYYIYGVNLNLPNQE